jgi:hypothetical protein
MDCFVDIYHSLALHNGIIFVVTVFPEKYLSEVVGLQRGPLGLVSTIEERKKK